jgi:predicted HTH domain antitoxin
MENAVVTTVRLEQKLLKELDALAEEENTDRTTIMKQALLSGLREMKLRYALQLYQEGKISVGKAKELSGITLWEFLEALKSRKIGFRTDESDLERQLKAFRK